MKEQGMYRGLDLFKLAAAFLVVAIHTGPLSSINSTADFLFTRVLGRTAVPFFFMVTGYFLFGPGTQPFQTHKLKIHKFAYKTLRLYGGAIMLYLPVMLYAGYFNSMERPIQLLTDLLAEGPFYHLWYLPAVVLGGYIVFFLSRKISVYKLFIVALVLYGAGLLGDSYYGFLSESSFLSTAYSGYFHVFAYTRNGLFFAPLFLIMGAMSAKVSKKDAGMSVRTEIWGLLLSLGLLLAEGLLLFRFHMQKHDSMYVFLIPCMFFLFRLLLRWKGAANPEARFVSMLIYIIHPLCILLVRGAAKILRLQVWLVDNSMVHFTAVCLISAFAAVCILILWKRVCPAAPVQMGRAWIEVDCKHLKNNIACIRTILPKQSEIMAVVKADAYGHGSREISPLLYQEGIRAFAVATVQEGISLRKCGMKGEILVLGYTFPGDVNGLIRYNLSQTVTDCAYAQLLETQCRQKHRNVKVHVKIDTGMHRLGEGHDQYEALMTIYRCRHLLIQGTYTHLCVSDSNLPRDTEFSKVQIQRFYRTAAYLRQQGIALGKLHIQSTYGVLNFPELECDYVRIGIGLYGVLHRGPEDPDWKMELRPVLSLKARVAAVKRVLQGETIGYGRNFVAQKDMQIAIVSIGYADGIPRMFGEIDNYVLIKGHKANVAGRICMDQLIVDVTNISNVAVHEIVTVVGREGEETISWELFAEWNDTIPNEVLSRLGARLERVYKG